MLPDGLAAAPKEAPVAVKDMIEAGNRLDHATYVYGGGHGPSLDTLQPSYDCSSSVSYVLHAGGVFGATAEVSGELESYGEAGPGRWVTVYANSEHAFMYVAGIRFDTSYNGTDTGPNKNQAARVGGSSRSPEMGAMGGPPPARPLTVKGENNMPNSLRKYLLLAVLLALTPFLAACGLANRGGAPAANPTTASGTPRPG